MTDQSISRFWDNFIEKTKSYDVKKDAARRYVRHAEFYIKHYKSRKLAVHNSQDVENYLKDKGRNKRLEDWQYKQIVISLKILFVDLVKSPWAKKFPWDEWIDMATSLHQSHPTVARDYQTIDLNYLAQDMLDKNDKNKGLFKKVFKQYPSHVEGIIKHIRIKHYSIRTEQAYLNWWKRIFLYFWNI